jgi:hypothetical protein
MSSAHQKIPEHQDETKACSAHVYAKLVLTGGLLHITADAVVLRLLLFALY